MQLNIFAVLCSSSVLFVNFFPGESAAGESSSDTKRSRFYRSGWPEDKFRFAPGSTAMLRCDHIGYEGDPRRAPPAFVTWFKDGQLIKSHPGKIKIFGGKRRPFIEGTKLSLMSLDPKDAGVYTCKLALKDTIPNPKYVLSMSVQVTVISPNNKTEVKKTTNHTKQVSENIKEIKNTTLNSVLPSKNQDLFSNDGTITELLVIFAIILVCVVFVSIFVVSYKLRKKSLVKASCAKNELGIIRFSSTKHSLKDVDEFNETFQQSNKTDSIYEIEDPQPDYVNLGKYKEYFPFIKDEEWTLLKKSQINRSRIKCHVEHAMPKVLGTGNFGQVYQGEITYCDGTKKSVAVKRLNDGCEMKEVGHFLKEAVSLLKTGHHQNVISLIGSVLLDTLMDLSMQQETSRPPILLMEVAEEGNLKSFLQSKRLPDNEILKSKQTIDEILCTLKQPPVGFVVGRELTLKDLASFLYQSAKGMQHLASKKIVHRDLAARNVLLTSNRVIKIADFGLSKHIREMQQEYYRVHSPSVTPAKWTAPEALNENVFSIHSDVWSYGILAWEIYTLGGAPYLNVPVMQLYQHLAAGNRLEKPSFASCSIYRTMEQCWNWEAQERPDFNDLVRFTDEHLTSLCETYVELSSQETVPNPNPPESDSNSDSLTSITKTLDEICDRSSLKSPDSGRSTESVFTFSSSDDDVSDDLIDSPVESDMARKFLQISEMMNPAYGFS